MNIVTYDLNTGKPLTEVKVTDEDIAESRKIFDLWILPLLKSLRKPGKNKAWVNHGKFQMTGWHSVIEYIGGAKEYGLSLRLSWEPADRERFHYLLKLGFIMGREPGERLTCPWVIEQGGITKLYISKRHYSLLVDEDIPEID